MCYKWLSEIRNNNRLLPLMSVSFISFCYTFLSFYLHLCWFCYIKCYIPHSFKCQTNIFFNDHTQKQLSLFNILFPLALHVSILILYNSIVVYIFVNMLLFSSSAAISFLLLGMKNFSGNSIFHVALIYLWTLKVKTNALHKNVDCFFSVRWNCTQIICETSLNSNSWKRLFWFCSIDS